MIHVCYAISDYSGHYCKFAGTSIQSILDNTREKVTIHFVHDDTLPAENRRKLTDIVRRHNQRIIFYHAENLAKDWCDRMRKIEWFARYGIGIGSMYRLLFPTLLPDDVEKVIYLDSDTIVNLDIKEFWNYDIQDAPIAAVSEYDAGANTRNYLRVKNGLIPFKEYINAGILVFNLEQIRKSGKDWMIENCIKICNEHPELHILDQESLAVLFLNRVHHLPRKFNLLLALERKRNHEILDAIYHFAGSKCLYLNPVDKYNVLYLSYFFKTPFCTGETFQNLFNECVRIFSESKKSVQDRLSNIQKTFKLKTQDSSTELAKDLFAPAAKRLPGSQEQLKKM